MSSSWRASCSTATKCSASRSVRPRPLSMSTRSSVSGVASHATVRSGVDRPGQSCGSTSAPCSRAGGSMSGPTGTAQPSVSMEVANMHLRTTRRSRTSVGCKPEQPKSSSSSPRLTRGVRIFIEILVSFHHQSNLQSSFLSLHSNQSQ